MSVIVLLVSVTGYFAYKYYFGRIHKVTVATDPTTRGASVNYLLVGVDSRAGDNASVGAGTTANVAGLRSDTMMIIHIAARTNKTTIISFPRDSRVDIPGHGFNKLNASLPLGGPDLLIKTLHQLTGMSINHYLQIDFSGFEKMTNALGGVDVCLSEPAIEPAGDKFTGINLSAGKHHLDGATALQYVRQRYGLTGGDIDRIKRQQAFIGSMIRKLTSARTLLDPLRLTKFLNVATKSITFDAGVTTHDLVTLATRLRKLDPAHVQFETIPTLGSQTIGGVSYVVPDDARLPAFFGAIKSDQASPSPTAAPTPAKSPVIATTPTPSATASPSPGAVTAAQDVCGA